MPLLCVRTSIHSCTCRTCITTLPTLSCMHTYLYIPADSVSYTVVASHKHTCGHTSFSAAPPSQYYYSYSETTHSCTASTSVLSCLDERTACIYVFSSDVCAFS